MDGKLNIYLDGPADAPKLLFIHGFNYFTEMYATFLNELIVSHRVLSIDLPGHGLTSAAPVYDLNAFVSAIQFALQLKQFSGFNVVGHSFGGFLALVCHSHPLVLQFNPL